MTVTPGGFAPVLAIYDFRSKQEYIYRTNRLQEISGASELIKGIYKEFFIELNKEHPESPKYIGLKDNISFSYDEFKDNENILGQALYEGGGTLMIIYRSEDIYMSANKRISRMVLAKTHSLSMIAAHIAFDESKDFREQRSDLYKKLSKCKSEIIPCLPCNVTPFTQISPSGHMPIAHVEYKGRDKVELSRESRLKRKKNEAVEKEKREKGIRFIDTSLLDEAVFEKGEDSLLAIVYIDGNNMGEKLKGCLDKCSKGETIRVDIDKGVEALRAFSADTEKTFVADPYAAIYEWTKAHRDEWMPQARNQWDVRQVIGGGDEITFICTAKLALKLVQIYFTQLQKSNKGKKDNEKNYACAGIAIFHSHAPFARVYDIAEECCENAKKKARAVRSETTNDGNYFDFYFCRSGLTNDMETIRETEEKGATGLPYAVDAFFKRINADIKPVFDKIGRANIKALTNAILSDSQGNADSGDDKENHAAFQHEAKRLNAYCGQKLFKDDVGSDDTLRKMLFDAGSVCDVWFAENQTYYAE